VGVGVGGGGGASWHSTCLISLLRRNSSLAGGDR